MALFAVRCAVCGGDQFRASPPEGWVEKYLLARFFICPGRCTACEKRRLVPMFQKLVTAPNDWR